jgi:NMD protein affecting ribosome stability and mRNA decay
MATHLTTARKDRLIQDCNHDPYKVTRKPAEPCVCPTCGAVFQDGRWQWLRPRPKEAHRELCQACRRTRDNYPAGLVTLHALPPGAQRDEMLNLVRNEAELEQRHHPMHRILQLRQQPSAVTISTTDIHLPRRLGEALHRAYKGRLEVTYDQDACFVRVGWRPAE